MVIQVKERTLQDVKTKFDSLSTDLIKMEYLESVVKVMDIVMEIKKFCFSTLAGLYEKRLMFDKAAKAMFLKAGYDVTYREKVDSLILAGEYNARAGNIISADDMFLRAVREGNTEQRSKVELARKNIYLSVANELEKKGRMNYAAKFFEHLLTLKLDELEKNLVKKKLVTYYKQMGRFN
ncbi:hypothetical protein KA107_00305 [Candidatus Pacearchaeota archaeon]|nr:hypothetical protein [Candidatus Pacearchaeota archaeon]